MKIFHRNHVNRSYVLSFVAVLIASILSGCKWIERPNPAGTPVETLKPAETTAEQPSDSTIVIDGEQATLRISKWVTATTQLVALKSEDWGGEWVAFARLVPPPYQQTRLSAATTTGDWILISPDDRFQTVTHVAESNTQGDQVFATREAIQFKPSSPDFQGLDRVRMTYWDKAKQASIWIDSVFIDGTWFSLPPEQGLTLLNAPYQLRCENSLSDEVKCSLHHRYEDVPVETYTAFKTAAGHEIAEPFFYANAKLTPSAASPYNYAKCNQATKTCILFVSLSATSSDFTIVPDWCAWIIDTCKDMGCYGANRGSYRCEITGCPACEK